MQGYPRKLKSQPISLTWILSNVLQFWVTTTLLTPVPLPFQPHTHLHSLSSKTIYCTFWHPHSTVNIISCMYTLSSYLSGFPALGFKENTAVSKSLLSAVLILPYPEDPESRETEVLLTSFCSSQIILPSLLHKNSCLCHLPPLTNIIYPHPSYSCSFKPSLVTHNL